MHLTERILGFMLLGSEWVLWLLIGLSVLSVAMMVERAIFLRARGDADALARELGALLRGGDVDGARQALCAAERAPAATVAAAGLDHFDRGSRAVGEAMAGAKARAAHRHGAQPRRARHARQQRAVHRPVRHRPRDHQGVRGSRAQPERRRRRR